MNIKMPADCFVPRLVTENADGDMPTSLSNSVLETWTQDFTVPIRANLLEARSWIGDKNAEALCGARGQSFRPRASPRLEGRALHDDWKELR